MPTESNSIQHWQVIEKKERIKIWFKMTLGQVLTWEKLDSYTFRSKSTIIRTRFQKKITMNTLCSKSIIMLIGIETPSTYDE